MQGAQLRDATAGDFEEICALNLAAEALTSPMDLQRLAFLDGLSCYHRVACVNGKIAAFLLAIRSGALYENDNFAWFGARFPDFLYVDRIVVSDASRGTRLGTRLYEDLFRFARHCGCPLVTCEYNISPPNEPSRRFHDRFGFQERGTQWAAHGSKQVSLQVAAIRPQSGGLAA